MHRVSPLKGFLRVLRVLRVSVVKKYISFLAPPQTINQVYYDKICENILP